MSKRFGRNQKRRMREHTAQLESDVHRFKQSDAMNRGLVEYLRDKNDDLRHELDVAKEMVIRYSALFAPTQIGVNWPSHDAFRRPIELPVQQAMPNPVWSMDFERNTVEKVKLHSLLTDCTADRITRALHVRVQFADGVQCYAVTDHAIRSMSRRELVRRISTELAEALAEELQGRVRR